MKTIATFIGILLLAMFATIAWAGSDTGVGVIRLSGNGDTVTPAVYQPANPFRVTGLRIVSTNTSTTNYTIRCGTDATGGKLFKTMIAYDDDGKVFEAGTTHSKTWTDLNWQLCPMHLETNDTSTSGEVYIHYVKPF